MSKLSRGKTNSQTVINDFFTKQPSKPKIQLPKTENVIRNQRPIASMYVFFIINT